MDDQQDNAYQEQDPGDLTGDGGHAEEAEGAGDESDYKKDKRVVNHLRSPFSRLCLIREST
jgi:hypothetical protein